MESFKGTPFNNRVHAIDKRMADEFKALTFDDVTIKDLPSDYRPDQVELSSYVTRDIRLNGCIISAAMDTVTEDEMGKAMARNGCLGIIHRNLSPEEQADMVRSVKRRGKYNCRIRSPVTCRATDTLSFIQKEIRDRHYDFSSFPILDKDGTLVGLITGEEMSFAGEDNPEVQHIMKPLEYVVTAPDTISDEAAYNLMRERKVKKLPLLDKDNRLNGMYIWRDIERHMKQIKNYTVDNEGNFRVGAAIGFSEEDMRRVDLLVAAKCDVIVMDSSHGACLEGRKQLERIKTKYPNTQIIIGNVASYESAKYLLQGPYYPDGIKCGIGSGTICTTRRVTGVGVPQLTAIYSVLRAVREMPSELRIPVIADGGIRCSGDMVKALAFGANCIMTGSLLAATYESPGQVIKQGDNRFKTYRGMGSREAMESRLGSRDRYLTKDDTSDNREDNLTNRQKQKVVPEGVQGMVKIKGTVEQVLTELHGGIKGGVAHCGADNLDGLRTNVVPYIQTSAGTIEGNPHSIIL